jgi:hypothetical protein
MRTESIDERHIACFISPHGFGHAARSSAIMEAASKLCDRARFEIFTEVPEWFFRQSLTREFGYHRLRTDLGLVQRTPLEVDLAETLRRLDEMLPFDERLIESLARTIRELRCELVVCDIAPLGIAVARAACVPSVLVENFTWDWIYEEYAGDFPRIQAHAGYLKEVFAAAVHHVQTEPVSVPVNRASLRTRPVSRSPRTTREVVRERLGLPDKAPAVLITMGGIETVFPFLELLESARDIFFVIPGGSLIPETRNNLVLLPHASEFYHPDLVGAVDTVVGKIGYSTLAESFHAGASFLYVMRRGFRESSVLAKFVDREMHGHALSEQEFARGCWLPRLKEMLSAPRRPRETANGAEDVAAYLMALLKEARA